MLALSGNGNCPAYRPIGGTGFSNPVIINTQPFTARITKEDKENADDSRKENHVGLCKPDSSIGHNWHRNNRDGYKDRELSRNRH